jgi:hypothetical protein
VTPAAQCVSTRSPGSSGTENRLSVPGARLEAACRVLGAQAALDRVPVEADIVLIEVERRAAGDPELQRRRGPGR